MSVVALPAIFEDMRRVLVGSHEGLLIMTVEAASLEAKSPTAAQSVALGTLCGNRGVLAERQEAHRRAVADKKTDLLSLPAPDQRQRVLAGGGFHSGMEDVGERLLGGDLLPVELQPSVGCGCHDVDLERRVNRAVLGTQNSALAVAEPR